MKYRARKLLPATLLAAVIAASLTALSCATANGSNYKQEEGYLYGKGSGKSAEEAEEKARLALIAAALGRADEEDFALSEEMSRSIKLPALKPFILDKGKDSTAVVYRLAKQEWDRLEASREASIRDELGSSFTAIRDQGDGAAGGLERSIGSAARLVIRLEREGLATSLTVAEGSSVLLASSIKDYCAERLEGASFSVLPSGGLIDDSSSFDIRIAAKDGRPLAAVPISIEWKSGSGKSLGAAIATTTDSKGSVSIDFPRSEAYSGQSRLRLSLASAFYPKTPEASFLKDLDAATKKEARYIHLADIKKAFFDEAKVPGGSFTAGAVKQDRKAERKEAPREATVGGFYIDRNLVTNALYAAFLEDTQTPASDYPVYWDNPDYNGPEQPVIGVSAKDAARFAEWVSAKTGSKKRLPTENEYEKAARGGAEVIYPWGDQSPTDKVRANYNGNGRFDGPSPVGSFETGKNAYGLYDMAGNVWEWTSSAGGGAGASIVKGGSWMDGPSELRVSNRRELEASEGYSDVGFRLVREVSND